MSCTHQCLDCFFVTLKRHPLVTPIGFSQIRKILMLWQIGHYKTVKVDREETFNLNYFELFILFLYASKSSNCQNLSI